MTSTADREYRVIVHAASGSTFAVGNPIVEFAHPKNIGYAEYLNDVGEAFFTIMQDDPNVQTHTGGTPIVDHIGITVTDSNGVSSNDTLDIGITDSVPVAVNDSASITEDGIPNTVSGNVYSNDSIGADVRANPVTAGTFTSANGYGTLVLNSDGSYTYTLNNNNAAVNALNNGQTLTDSYSYTITDADGSTSTATLVITINGHTDGVPVISIPDTDGGANATDSTLPETAAATALLWSSAGTLLVLMIPLWCRGACAALAARAHLGSDPAVARGDRPLRRPAARLRLAPGLPGAAAGGLLLPLFCRAVLWNHERGRAAHRLV